MHDFMCDKAEDMYYEVLRNKVKYYKENQEGRREMCEIMDNIRNKGRLEGLAEGKLKGKLEGLAEGKIVGLTEGKMNTLIQLLHQRLGKLTPEIELQIQKSTEEQLNELTIHIFDVENEEDIMKVLAC